MKFICYVLISLVGVSCPKLEVINIKSRIKQENFHTYFSTLDQVQQQPIQDQQDDAQNGPPPNDGVQQDPLPNPMHYFPGITLRFCVSDIGLQALQTGCKSLRRITMNKISNHSTAQLSRESNIII